MNIPWINIYNGKKNTRKSSYSFKIMNHNSKYYILRLSIYFIFGLVALQDFGCTLTVYKDTDIIYPTFLENVKIKWIVLKTGEMIVFDKEGGYLRVKPNDSQNEYIFGATAKGKVMEINIKDIVKLHYEDREFDSDILYFIFGPIIAIFFVLGLLTAVVR
jgi:hypothetical protein